MSSPAHIHIELESGQHQMILAGGTDRSVADILAACGFPLNTRCGQRGLCRGCEILLREGTVMINGEEVAAPATVQSCRARITSPLDIRIEIPARSSIEHRPQVGETFEIAISYSHQPLFPTMAGGRDTAFAVDVGTTTVVVLMVDLITGEVLSRASAFNEQIRFGDNVVTRIEAARKPDNLAAMKLAIVEETIQPLLHRACERAGRTLDRIVGGAVAGNTTMLHLLVGEDPTPLGIAPFTPVFLEGRQVFARDLVLAGDGLLPETPIQLLPCIAAYIGADIAAGICATGMAFDPSPSLLIDIGTNGEIVLQTKGKLTACAAAAGPAFEGCGLRCGTRARHGAISDLRLTLEPFELETKIIGNVPLVRANGLCGSAYVDFLATARSTGLLGATGRFDQAGWARVPMANRFADGREMALRLTASDGAGGLRVGEVDVALLLQAKAAIGAGIEILLATAGLEAADLSRVYLAGGFGMHLNVAHAIAIGLLPGFREQQVRMVGNTSLAGALLALVDRTMLDEMEQLRALVEVIELNLADGFEDRYIGHLTLP